MSSECGILARFRASSTNRVNKTMLNFNSHIPLSLYIHLPWCVRKCPYCDFNSHAVKSEVPEAEYVEALKRDLDENLPSTQGRRLVSIFFGGGTPSLFSPQAIQAILEHVHKRLHIHRDTEVTLEANPGTVDEARFAGFRHAGINRLSIGIQSLQDEKLKSLGRIHNRDYALRAIDIAVTAGFHNFNLDIMHGLPEQSLHDAAQDIKDALGFQPPHFSWYQLTIEPNTLFYHQRPTIPEDEILWDIQECGKKIIAAAGLKQYEVSAYALPGKECQHNLNYWEFGDYLGIGAGAHSKITDTERGIITRHWQVKNPKNYLDPAGKMTGNHSVLSNNDIIFEFMLNALRLTNGVPLSLFTERTGLPIDLIKDKLTIAQNNLLLEKSSTMLKTTEHGQKFLNDLISLFLVN